MRTSIARLTITDTVKKKDKIAYVAESVTVANTRAVVAANRRFNAQQGHGYAAEYANHMIDRVRGKHAALVGQSNARDGADRKVGRTLIQTKYCRSPEATIRAYLTRDYGVRYKDLDGRPMKLEVPSDQYLEARKAMRRLVREGKLKGITEDQAAKCVIKGKVTYAQAERIAKAGTIEGLTYDAANGVLTAAGTAGISSAITFALSIWNGESLEDALQAACVAGLQVGGMAFATTVIASQLARRSVLSETAAKASAFAAAALPVEVAPGTEAIKRIIGQYAIETLTAVIAARRDIADAFDGRISLSQLAKNSTIRLAGIAGASAGRQAGTKLGGEIGRIAGSFTPYGPVVGKFAGSIVGALVGGWFATSATKTVLDVLIEDDAPKLLRILQKEFIEEADAALLAQSEIERALTLMERDLSSFLRQLHATNDRRALAREFVGETVNHAIAERRVVRAAPDEDLAGALCKAAERGRSPKSNPDAAWPFNVCETEEKISGGKAATAHRKGRRTSVANPDAAWPEF